MKSAELQTLADEFSLPKRQLSEAQEVLLYNGMEMLEIPGALKDLCENTKAHGGGVEIFAKLLAGQIAILKAMP